MAWNILNCRTLRNKECDNRNQTDPDWGAGGGNKRKKKKKKDVFSLSLMCEGRHTLGHILPAESISATEQPLLSSEGSHRDPMWGSTHIPFTGWCYHPRHFKRFLSRSAPYQARELPTCYSAVILRHISGNFCCFH